MNDSGSCEREEGQLRGGLSAISDSNKGLNGLED